MNKSEECREGLMIHGPENTIYPKAGLFRTGRSLYDVRALLKGGGMRYLELFVSKTCDRIVGVMERVLREECWIYTYIGVEAGNEQQRTYFCVRRELKTPPVVVHVWRIQRAIRGYLERRRRVRRLAVMMGLHSRLGSECALAVLPADVVRMNIVGVSRVGDTVSVRGLRFILERACFGGDGGGSMVNAWRLQCGCLTR